MQEQSHSNVQVNPEMQSFLDLLISNLRATLKHSATTQQLKRATAALQSVEKHPLVIPALFQIMCGEYQKHLKQAASSRLSKCLVVHQDPARTTNQIMAQVLMILRTSEPTDTDNLVNSLSKLISKHDETLNFSLFSSISVLIFQADTLRTVANYLAFSSQIIPLLSGEYILKLHKTFVDPLLQNYAGRLLEQIRQIFKEYLDEPEPIKMKAVTDGARVLSGLAHILLQMIDALGEEEEQSVIFEECLQKNEHFAKFASNLLTINLGSTGMICTSELEVARKINSCKSDFLVVLLRIYQGPPAFLFQIFWDTFIGRTPFHDDQDARQILSHVTTMIQRYSVDKKYYAYFSDKRIQMIFKILEMFQTNADELEHMKSQPEYFVELSVDVCDTQDLDELKTRAASLLGSLCLTIDGFLNMTIQVCIIFIDWPFIQQHQQHDRYKPYLQVYKLYKFYHDTLQSKIQTCFMVMASLADQLDKRTELKKKALTFIYHRHKYIMALKSELVRCRYIQFFQYFPCIPIFKDLMVCLEKPNSAEFLQFVECIQYVFKNCQKRELLEFLSSTSMDILTRISCYHSLFQSILDKNFQLFNTLENTITVMNVLALQMQKLYSHHHCNQKLTKNINLVSRHIETVVTKTPATEFSETIESLLIPVFGLVLTCQQCQSNIIELATTIIKHVKKVSMVQKQFLPLALQVVVNNKNVLNSCSDLFNQHIKYSDSPESKDLIFQRLVCCINQSSRVADLWESVALAELYVLQCSSPQIVPIIVNLTLPKLKFLAVNLIDDSKLAMLKLVQLLGCVLSNQKLHKQMRMMLEAQNAYSDVMSMLTQTQHLLCLKQRRVYTVYLTKILQNQAEALENVKIKALISTIVTILEKIAITPSQAASETRRKWGKGFQEFEMIPDEDPGQIFSFQNQSHISIFEKQSKLEHPFDKIDLYERFRECCENLRRKLGHIEFLDGLDRTIVNKYLQFRMVGDQRMRRIVKIKRN